MPAYKKKEKVFGENRFVFAIIKHPVLGMLIEAYVVKENKKGVFAYFFNKVTSRNYHDYFTELNETEIKGLEIIDNYSDEMLLKRFWREKIRVKDFLVNLEDEFVKKHIKPYIDKRTYELVTLLAENDLPVFYKGGFDDRVQEEEIKTSIEHVEVAFNFDKKDEHTSYHLELFYNDNLLNITGNEAEIISEKPCVLLLDKQLYRFEETWEGKKLIPFLNKKEIIIPKSSEKAYFQKFVLNAIKNYNVKASGFTIHNFTESFTPLLKIENTVSGKVAAALYFNYGDNVAYPYRDKSDTYTTFDIEGEKYIFNRLQRDKEKEQEYADFLKSIGLSHFAGPHFFLKESNNNSQVNIAYHQKIIDWVSENKKILDIKGFKLEQEFSKFNYLTLKPVIDISIDEKQDWFDLNISVHFGEHKIPFVKLKDNILKGEREYTLPDGNIALLPVEWFARFKEIMKFGTKNEDKINLKRHHYTLLTGLVNGEKGLKHYEKLDITKNIDIPEALNAKLRPYQIEGYQWINFLQKNSFGGVLADDMGLGKTLQVITMLTRIYKAEDKDKAEVEVEAEVVSNVKAQEGFQLDIFSKPGNFPIPASLIVMPLSLIHNWIREMQRFSPELRVYQHVGSNRLINKQIFDKYDVILTTYGTVRNDVSLLKSFEFYYVILDESQIIKNAGSKIYHAVKELKAKHRLVLTGTPVENSLTDLWSQFSFLNPGLLGSLNFFKEEFATPIERDKNLFKKQKLHDIINPFILRRTKDEVEKDLPELTEMVHYCEMTEEQLSIYEEKKSEVRNFILDKIKESGFDKSRFHILSGLMSLRLIANHPVMAVPDYNATSGKYVEIIRSIEKLISENHKVLVFSQFVKHLNLIKLYLDKNNLTYSFLTGNTAEKDRKRLINEFQNNDETKLFLISLKAGGVGLNLTGADYVFLLDPWWNPAVENQAINRAHRIGQHKKVFVYKFITRNSVEEKIMNLQQQKSELAGMIINSNNPLKTMGVEQIKGLL